ncbi:DUF1214 domain-containing protein [Okeania sp. SIO2B3]|uniref:DUF1214 domain-containing protein n=1 Tax=Okeania sp. SIO2B3 TaxID=2607784 RepID=UPI0025E827CB|nr:DUF1214 domain-containing protein [Okeania sp. SIO2B3]
MIQALFIFILFAVAFLSSGGQVLAQDGENPISGKPPIGSEPSVDDFDYQVKYQRAFEAVIWSRPALGIYSFRRAAFDWLGYQDNDIIAYSELATPRLEALTANSSTSYIAAFTDLRKGPVVVEIPAAGDDGSLYGQVVDAWHLTIADVGPSGIDKGEGGKIVFTPPGYNKEIDDNEYIHVPSPNYRIAFAFRSVVLPGKTLEDAYEYAKRTRIYYLSEADEPPEPRFIDPINDRYPTLPLYDEHLFEDIYDIVTVEPVQKKDKVMMGMLKSLGIERGKPFSPDETTELAMRQAAIDGWHYLQYLVDKEMINRPYWEDRHYYSLQPTDANNKFDFTYEDRIDLIERALPFFWGTFYPKELAETPTTEYTAAIADKDGNLLEADKLYKVNVPADVPVEQFWGLTVYDRDTFSFIYSASNRTTLSSYDIEKMETNADGSVTLYVGPNAPDGLESNWIPTSGKRPMPVMRFYGLTEEFKDSFIMPDFELVE